MQEKWEQYRKSNVGQVVYVGWDTGGIRTVRQKKGEE